MISNVSNDKAAPSLDSEMTPTGRRPHRNNELMRTKVFEAYIARDATSLYWLQLIDDSYKAYNRDPQSGLLYTDPDEIITELIRQAYMEITYSDGKMYVSLTPDGVKEVDYFKSKIIS